MNVINYFFWLLWRIWFYILILLPIVICSPFLLLFISNDKWYPYFYKIARLWGKIIIIGMGFFPEVIVEKPLEKGKSYMFIANHTSMLDIMLMLYIVKENPFVFVGKAELAKYPVFGYFYKKTCILVDRASKKSRVKVFESARERIAQGLSICIFPEGGVPEDTSIILDNFKDGAFRLAIEHQIPIVPMSFKDNKKRFPFQFFSGSPGKMRAKIHTPISTKGKTLQDKNTIKQQAKTTILKEL